MLSRGPCGSFVNAKTLTIRTPSPRRACLRRRPRLQPAAALARRAVRNEHEHELHPAAMLTRGPCGSLVKAKTLTIRTPSPRQACLRRRPRLQPAAALARRAVHNAHEHDIFGILDFRKNSPGKKKRRLLNNMATDQDAEQSLRDVGLRTNPSKCCQLVLSYIILDFQTFEERCILYFSSPVLKSGASAHTHIQVTSRSHPGHIQVTSRSCKYETNCLGEPCCKDV